MPDKTKRKNDSTGWVEFLSLPLLFALWHLLAIIVQSRLLPTPFMVFTELWDLSVNGKLIADMSKTLTRTFIAFCVAMTIGGFLGAILGRFRLADRLFGTWVVVGLNIPAIIVAIACYIWLGLSEFALILAVVINKVPLVITIIREGMRNLSADLDELAAVYRLPFVRHLRFVTIPQLMPFILNAARTGLSLIWKIVLVFEVLGSDGGIGFRIGLLFQYFDITGILAYTLAFVVIVIIIEYGVMRPIERKILGWRPAQT